VEPFYIWARFLFIRHPLFRLGFIIRHHGTRPALTALGRFALAHLFIRYSGIIYYTAPVKSNSAIVFLHFAKITLLNVFQFFYKSNRFLFPY
jgi:hypothetical protein